MTVELMPVKNNCNLKCSYCYEDSIRLIPENNKVRLNVKQMLDKIPQGSHGFTVFGGEPLLTPKAELIKIFEHGLRVYGQNSIQTNGVLIDEEYIRLFQEYNVSVGISIDGSGKLNDARSQGTPERTREATNKIEWNIMALLDNDIVPSIIVTLHKLNVGDDELLAGFISWIKFLDLIGIRYLRLHPLENESIHSGLLKLSDEKEIYVYRELYRLQKKLKNIEFDIFSDIRKLLTEESPSVSCVWNNCDTLTTEAVYGIDSEGEVVNCGRTYKDGIVYKKLSKRGNERAIALYSTSQEHGGCKGCEYFYACKGNCPGTAIQGDWRNRSEHCLLFKDLFGLIRKDLPDSIPDHPEKVQVLEQRVLDDQRSQNREHIDTPHVDFYKFLLPLSRDGKVKHGGDFGTD